MWLPIVVVIFAVRSQWRHFESGLGFAAVEFRKSNYSDSIVKLLILYNTPDYR